MKCEMGCGKEKTRVKWCKYVCETCEPPAIFNFLPVGTVNYKYYYKKNGNVSANRVKEFKSRCIHPEGKGEVVMRKKDGTPSDKKAVNY
jgi:hypothetical protein